MLRAGFLLFSFFDLLVSLEEHDLIRLSIFHFLIFGFFFRPFAHPLFYLLRVHLADVLLERFDLEIQRFGDIDPCIDLIGAVDVETLDVMRFVPSR